MKKIIKKQTFLTIVLVILVPVFFVNFLIFVLAWNPPTEPAPGGNPPPPLHVGEQVQYKEGSLSIGALFESLAVVFIPDLSSQPTCNEETRGTIWVEDNEGEDPIFLCKWDGSQFIWFEVLN